MPPFSRCFLRRTTVIVALTTGIVAGCMRPQVDPGGIDLIDLFHLAEVHSETTVIEFGEPEARSLLVSGWGRDEAEEGRRFVWGLGQRSVLRLFLSHARDLELALACWALEAPDRSQQRMLVRVNGETVAEIEVDSEPGKRHRISVPARVLKKGHNRIAFRYSRSVQPLELEKDSADDRPLAVAWDRLEVLGGRPHRPPRTRPGSRTLILPAHTRVDYFLRLHPGMELVIESVNSRGTDPHGPWLRVDAATEGGTRQTFEIAGAAAAANRWRRRFKLSSPQPARLSFRAISDSANARGAVEIVAPRLYGAPRPPPPAVADTGSALSAQPSAGQAPSQTPERPPIIVYLIDTLRADHLGCYGYDKPTSPNIDAFSRDAVLFERAMAQSSWTRPTVASVFTGQFPQAHGVNRPADALPLSVPTLPRLLHDLGYETGGFTTNVVASEEFGFGRGFDHFEHLDVKDRPKEYWHAFHQQSDRLNEVAFQWLEGRSLDRPFFLYLHSTDPHLPYTPRSPFDSKLAAGVKNPDVGSWPSVKGLERFMQPTDEAKRQDIIALYDGEIAFNDASFGALIEYLKAANLYQSAMIVLIADHGEEFFDHGRWEHSRSLFQEQLRVPLLIKFPDRRIPPRRIDEVVRQVDVLPTLLDYLDATAPEVSQGVSLLPRLLHPERQGNDLPAYAYLQTQGRTVESFLFGHMKLIRYLAFDRPHDAIELFDLDQDPGEAHNLARTRPILAGYYKMLLRSSSSAWQPQGKRTVFLDEEMRQQLKALGYL